MLLWPERRRGTAASSTEEHRQHAQRRRPVDGDRADQGRFYVAAHTTVQGESFTASAALAISDKRARVSNLVATDVLTSNGVIHVVDKVILPAP